MMKTLFTQKISFQLVEIVSIVFVSASSLLQLIPIFAGGFVALSLVLLNLAKAYKIYSETKRDNKKDNE